MRKVLIKSAMNRVAITNQSIAKRAMPRIIRLASHSARPYGADAGLA